MQASLKQLLFSIAFLAAACVGLFNASAVWASLWLTTAVLLLLFSLLKIIFATGQQRTFWIGFAIFGWVYFVLHYSLSFSSLRDSFQQTGSAPGLITTRFWEYMYLHIPPLVDRTSAPTISGGMTGGIGGVVFYVDSHFFMSIAHSITLLVVAVCGGITALFIDRKNHRSNSNALHNRSI